MSSAQGSPLLNCTWREIPLNSSWQRQWAGMQIKESQSKRPINTSHSLASLQTLSPWPGLHAPPANPQSWAAWHVRERRMQVSSWVHAALLHTRCVLSLVSLCLHQNRIVPFVACVTLWKFQELCFSSHTPLMSHQAPDDWSCSWRRPGVDLPSTKKKKMKRATFNRIATSIK